MGRHRKFPVKNRGDVVKESALSGRPIDEAVMERLGLRDMVCMSCNARVPKERGKCRKCGGTELRKKHVRYADDR